jgi:hypothetical protein
VLEKLVCDACTLAALPVMSTARVLDNYTPVAQRNIMPHYTFYGQAVNGRDVLDYHDLQRY